MTGRKIKIYFPIIRSFKSKLGKYRKDNKKCFKTKDAIQNEK